MQWKYTGTETLPNEPHLIEARFARVIAAQGCAVPLLPEGTFISDLNRTFAAAQAWADRHGLALMIEYGAACKFPYAAHVFTRRGHEVASAWTDHSGGAAMAVVIACLAAALIISEPPPSPAEPPKGGL